MLGLLLPEMLVVLADCLRLRSLVSKEVVRSSHITDSLLGGRRVNAMTKTFNSCLISIKVK